MMQIGRIIELWRYPVSSLGGETCQSIHAEERRISGDRQFGLFDSENGNIAAPEKDARWRPALFLSSRVDETGKTIIRFPDKTELKVSDHDINTRLSSHFGFDVAIGQYADMSPDLEPQLPIINRAYAPSPLHILTSASIESVRSGLTSGESDLRRFRPSLLIETQGQEGFPENDWIGAILHVGQVRAIVIERTKRCGMTLIPQPGLPEQPDVLRTILRHNQRCLGVYCDIVCAGSISVGDAIYIED